MYSLGSKLANKKVQKVSWPLVQNLGVYEHFSHIYIYIFRSIERSPTRNCNIKYKHFPLVLFLALIYCIGMAQIVWQQLFPGNWHPVERCFFSIGLRWQFWQHHNKRVYFTKGSGWSKYCVFCSRLQCYKPSDITILVK